MSERYGLAIGHVLHATDFAAGSTVAFAHALRLACAAKSTLSILHIERAEDGRPDWSQFPAVRDTLARWGMLPEHASKSDVAGLGVRIGKASVTDPDPVAGVLGFLDEHPADLLVLATQQRHGLDRWLHQTTAGRINAGSDGATLFLPVGCTGFVQEDTGQVQLRNIVVPIDFEPDPEPAIEVVCDIVNALEVPECHIHLLHIGDPADSPGVSLPGSPAVSYHWHTAAGSVVSTILQRAQQLQADLIAMTTAGRNGLLDALRGSTTEQVLEHSGCPVLAVHEWLD
ncbi:MAG: universal stress protein [Planctomycetaceae bacterium]|jgi:nucleotide-binding universal stress UspA family protein